jgi:hypothetical protein
MIAHSGATPSLDRISLPNRRGRPACRLAEGDRPYAPILLLEQHPGGAGYLLKERVSGVGVLADALVRVSEGECVIDPTIVSRLLRRARPASAFGQLTRA